MRFETKYDEIEFKLELSAEEVEALGAGAAAAVQNPDMVKLVFDMILGKDPSDPDEPEEEEDESEEEEVPDKEAGKFKVPCRTWNHRYDEQKYKFVKNWLRRRKIPFEEEPGLTRSYITYELTLAQLERLQRSMKEAFGDDFDTEINV